MYCCKSFLVVLLFLYLLDFRPADFSHRHFAILKSLFERSENNQETLEHSKPNMAPFLLVVFFYLLKSNVLI